MGETSDSHVINKKATVNHNDGQLDHTAKLQQEAINYKPSTLNHQVLGEAANHPLDRSKCSVGPKLNDLTIDEGISVKDTPNNSDSYAQREATKKHDMPISNQHYRDILKDGAERLHNGDFSLQLRNALDEAFKSDVKDKSGGKHVEDLLKYANSALCGSENTLAREGKYIKQIVTTPNSTHLTNYYYNLETKSWDNTKH